MRARVRPESGPGPGVLVLHPWWGLNGTMRDVCDRLAEAGYTAFAPDLYDGRVTTTAEEAEVLAARVFDDPEPTRQRVRTALDHLEEQAIPYAPLGVICGLERELQAAGRPVAFHTYPGTGHWFFEPDRTDAYAPVAARLAWERTLAFLGEEIPR